MSTRTGLNGSPRRGRRALGDGDWPRAAAVLREALELWRGPALADATGTPAQAARLDELRLAALEDRVEADLALGAQSALIAELRELVVAHPLRERSRGQLMRALAALGRPAEALAEFEDARHTLAEQLGVDPSAELAAVHLAVLRGEERGSAEPALPSQLTTFVGREEELKRVGDLLGERRLVTLTGPGGRGQDAPGDRGRGPGRRGGPFRRAGRAGRRVGRSAGGAERARPARRGPACPGRAGLADHRSAGRGARRAATAAGARQL
ncbi:AfsR/SARP family transcriptional regulator [Micromonospora sp. STR1s_5]|nr:AfsR/SARP family transcriptional regulator [Micromonospora sp. STR1s_5]